jgi:hypothetical protein
VTILIPRPPAATARPQSAAAATPKPRGGLIFDDDPAPASDPPPRPTAPAARARNGDREVIDVLPIDEPPVRARRRPDQDAADDYEEDRPRRGRPRDEEDAQDWPRNRGGPTAWGKVRIALLVVAIAGCGLAAAQACQILADLFLVLALAKGSGGGAIGVFTKIAIITALVAGAGIIVGYVFCLFAPNRKGALPLAITALSLGGVNLVLGIIFKVIPAFKTEGAAGFMFAAAGGGEAGALILALFLHLLYAGEFVTFPLFMRALAGQLAEAGRARAWMINVFLAGGYGVCLLLMDVLMLVAAKNASQGLFWVGLITRCLADLLFAAYLVWYILLLFRSRADLG